MNWISLVEGIGIVMGLIIAFWGLVHQLSIEKILHLLKEVNKKEEYLLFRLFAVNFAAHGALISLCGFLPAVLLFFHGFIYPSVRTSLLLCGTALILLAILAYTAWKESRKFRLFQLGCLFELSYGLFLVILVVFGPVPL